MNAKTTSALKTINAQRHFDRTLKFPDSLRNASCHFAGLTCKQKSLRFRRPWMRGMMRSDDILCGEVCTMADRWDEFLMERCRVLRRGQRKILEAPARIELATRSLGNCCSIQLSYGACVGTAIYRLSAEVFGRQRILVFQGCPHGACAYRTYIRSIHQIRNMATMAPAT